MCEYGNFFVVCFEITFIVSGKCTFENTMTNHKISKIKSFLFVCLNDLVRLMTAWMSPSMSFIHVLKLSLTTTKYAFYCFVL